VLSVEPLTGLLGPGGAADVETTLAFDGSGEGTRAGVLDPAAPTVAAHWTGSGLRRGRLTFTLRAGAEMTCQEVRFIPVRFKDAYGPVGAWFLLFKSRATNAMGGEYMVERKPELDKFQAEVDRRWVRLKEMHKNPLL